MSSDPLHILGSITGVGIVPGGVPLPGALPVPGATSLESLIGELGKMDFVPPSAEELDVRFQEILGAAARASAAGSVVLYFGDKDTFGPVAQGGADANAVIGEYHRLSASCTVFDRVVSTGQPVVMEDVSECDEGVPHVCRFAAARGGSKEPLPLIAVPVKDSRGHVLGILELVGGQAARAFASHVVPLAEAFASQVGSAVVSAQLAARLRQAQFESVFRLSVAAEFRDPETAAHIQRMSRYSAIIAQHLGLGVEEVELIRFASPMHDVGKLGVPDAILLKPSKLDEDEWRTMCSHTIMGARILEGSDSPIMQTSEKVALSHHEKFNGAGYPLGIPAEGIPLSGRIVALGDALDAITSRRCYKDAIPLERGMEIVKGDAGSHFDPDCVAALERGLNEVAEVHAHFAALENEANS